MCRICVEYQMGKLTSREAFRNMGEIINTSKSQEEKDHMVEVTELIMSKEAPMSDSDPEMDAIYQDEINRK